jgi:Tol biopolymer transport system component
VFERDLRTGKVWRVNVSSTGQQANDWSQYPSVSANGRYALFESYNTNWKGTTGYNFWAHDNRTGRTWRIDRPYRHINWELAGGTLTGVISANGRWAAYVSDDAFQVPHDTNQGYDVFERNLRTGRVFRVSVTSRGGQANFADFYGGLAISHDGRDVAFVSYSTNLIAGRRTLPGDVFLHDRVTGRTSQVDVSSGGVPANEIAFQVAISANGQIVAFDSYASNLVPSDANSDSDVFVHDVRTRRTTRVSRAIGGRSPNAGSGEPTVSARGRYVAFTSAASDLVAADTNRAMDVFRYDRRTGRTIRISIGTRGQQATDNSAVLSMDASGCRIAFLSDADNLVAGDTNGWPDIFLRLLPARC